MAVWSSYEIIKGETMKVLTMFFTIFGMASLAYCQDSAVALSTIIEESEKKFGISIAYNASEIIDEFGDPIKVNIQLRKYRREELMTAIEMTTGGKFEKINSRQWVLKPPKVVRMENMKRLSNRIEAIEDRISNLTVEMNLIEKRVKQVLKNK
jgi:hypothetical protein